MSITPDTVTRPETLSDEEQKRLQKLLPFWCVILHNDHNWADHVVQTLQKVVGLPYNQARAIMLEAHTHGQATAITCAKEQAEQYQAGLECHGLTSTIEPAG